MSEPARPMWTKKNDDRYVRIDDAVVMWDQRSPYPNSMNPRSKMWTAWEPGESQSYLAMGNGRLTWPKRFKTADAAMRAVDKAFPFYVFVPEPPTSAPEREA